MERESGVEAAIIVSPRQSCEAARFGEGVSGSEVARGNRGLGVARARGVPRSGGAAVVGRIAPYGQHDIAKTGI